jgi:signal transduction histidine kinase
MAAPAVGPAAAGRQRGGARRAARGLPALDDPALRYLHRAYADMQDAIDVVLYRDAAGEPRWRLAAGAVAAPQLEALADPVILPASASSALDVLLPIADHATGRALGTMEARVRLSGFVPAEPGGVNGAVLGVIDRATGRPILAPPFEPALLARNRFAWEGQRWLAVRRSLDAPAIDLVLAAPLDPFTEPFERAARQGAFALVAVAFGAFLLGGALTRRLTGSLERLAEAADAVARGDLDRKVEVAARDEVGRVAHTFNAMTESLRRTLRELSQRQALAAVGEFASALAHEIRNPLTSIRLDLQLAEEKLPEDSRARGPLGRALREIERLNRTVSGGLRVARSGRIGEERLDVRVPLERAAHAAAPEFAARGATLEPLPPASDPAWIRGDAGALEQLFLNLLLNAAQALEAGGRAGARLETGERDVLVSIWDTGPGIAPERLERIFEPFFTTKQEGTGLGLAIAQRIVAAHGGEIRIDSSVGQGTAFHIRLPLEGGLRLPA